MSTETMIEDSIIISDGWDTVIGWPIDAGGWGITKEKQI